MCMLFIRCNNKCTKEEFSLVVVSIRDEYFMRPTRLCSFWSDNPNIIGGMDLEDGREGGTWLGMSKEGQVGVLLNILQPLDGLQPGKKNRGFLVPQFLRSGVAGPEFLRSVAQTANEHADFVMITMDMSPGIGTCLSYFTNMDGRDAPTTLIGPNQPGYESGVFAFANNLPQKPWIKTIVGRKMFENITSRNNEIKNKHKLVHELFDMIDDDTAYFPDSQLMSDGRGYDVDYLKGLSSLRVRIPLLGFGSRTQSIILVDQEGKVTFVERTIGEEVLDMSKVTSMSTSPTAAMRSFQFRIRNSMSDQATSLPIYSLSSRL